MPRSRSAVLLFHALLLASLLACTGPAPLPQASPDASRTFDAALPDVSPPDAVSVTQVSFDGGTSAVDPGVACEEAPDSGARPLPDASADAAPCEGLHAGDLVFNEAMLSTLSGSSDHGQWLEVESSRDCRIDLNGLHASAPHGSTFRTMDVTAETWLPPHGFFLIADTLDESENGKLPGLVFAWAGSPEDAIHKTSDTITLSKGKLTVATLVYPDKKRTEGTSMAFPTGCAPSLREDFTSWLPSTASWTRGLFGTPGRANTDVTCAVATVPTCTPRRSR